MMTLVRKRTARRRLLTAAFVAWASARCSSARTARLRLVSFDRPQVGAEEYRQATPGLCPTLPTEGRRSSLPPPTLKANP